MKKIKFGFIGCGWIVQKTYMPILKEKKDVELLAVYDIDYNKSLSCTLKFDIKQVCNSVEALLDTDVDVVIIATPNYTHENYSMKAIRKNKHVVCEKPTVLYVEEYKQLREEAKRRGCIFLPAYVNRFRSEIIELQQIIESGVIGKVTSVEAGWIRKNGYPNLGSWFTNKMYSGGGVLLDLGSHILDISLMLLPCETIPKKVVLSTWYNEFDDTDIHVLSAQWYENNEKNIYEVNVETSAIAEVLFQQDISLNIKLSWNATTDYDETYFNVSGESGKVTLRTLFGFSTNRLGDKNEMQIVMNDGEQKSIFFIDVMKEQMKSFEKLCEYIIRCTRNEESPESIIDNGQKVIELTEQLYKNEIVKI